MTQYYTVKGGESWVSISRDQLGNSRAFGELMAANGGGFMLRPGQQIILPDSISANPFISNELAAAVGMATSGQIADAYKLGKTGDNSTGLDQYGRMNWGEDLVRMNRMAASMPGGTGFENGRPSKAFWDLYNASVSGTKPGSGTSAGAGSDDYRNTPGYGGYSDPHNTGFNPTSATPPALRRQRRPDDYKRTPGYGGYFESTHRPSPWNLMSSGIARNTLVPQNGSRENKIPTGYTGLTPNKGKPEPTGYTGLESQLTKDRLMKNKLIENKLKPDLMNLDELLAKDLGGTINKLLEGAVDAVLPWRGVFKDIPWLNYTSGNGTLGSFDSPLLEAAREQLFGSESELDDFDIDTGDGTGTGTGTGDGSSVPVVPDSGLSQGPSTAGASAVDLLGQYSDLDWGLIRQYANRTPYGYERVNMPWYGQAESGQPTAEQIASTYYYGGDAYMHMVGG